MTLSPNRTCGFSIAGAQRQLRVRRRWLGLDRVGGPARLVRHAQRPVRQLDSTTAADGHTSLKIELTPENMPVAFNDYLHTQRWPIKAPLAANVGWITVKPGPTLYVLGGHESHCGGHSRPSGRSPIPRRPHRQTRQADHRVATLSLGVHARDRGRLCAGRPRFRRSPRESRSFDAGNGLARRRATCAQRRGRLRHPSAGRVRSDDRKAGQYLRLGRAPGDSTHGWLRPKRKIAKRNFIST